jgi:hypothetical protein
MKFPRSRLLLGALVVLLLGGMAAVCLERTTLTAWYHVYRLKHATEAEREVRAACVAGDGEAAVAGLIDCLGEADERVCGNAKAALVRLDQRWDRNDPRSTTVARRLAESFSVLSPAGQRSVLELAAAWMSAAAPGETKAAAAHVLSGSARSSDAGVRERALALATTWLALPNHTEAVGVCSELVRAGLHDSEAANRVAAVHLAVHTDLGLVPSLAVLLDDPAADVRRAALAAIGGPDAQEAVATDDLLRSLHDTDADVRRLCEAALRSRGLSGNDVALARLITDANPGTRLQVLERLNHAANLEPGVWLRRLSEDSSAAVRAAAVRAAAESEQVDLSDRLEKMAKEDASATVRQLADYYLTQQKVRQQSP